jgi:hypothetical protein
MGVTSRDAVIEVKKVAEGGKSGIDFEVKMHQNTYSGSETSTVIDSPSYVLDQCIGLLEA